ncbi:MAG: hypothetical protein ACYC27_20345 [Armatimonadota bacterium]
MSNQAWALGSKYGIAYLEDRKLIDEILKLEGSQSRINEAVMATYFSPKGKPFAWQMIFNMNNWNLISEALGVKTYEKKPVSPAVSESKTGSRKIEKPKAARIRQRKSN